MNDWLRWILIVMGLLYAVIAMSFLVRKKISEVNTIVWMGTCVIILVLSLNTGMLDWLAKNVGVEYPPSLLFLFSLLILMLLTLYQSIQISQLQEKIKDLSQYVALQDVDERPKPEQKHIG